MNLDVVAITPSDEELSAVEIFGGNSIMWDELGQIFRIEDLQNHIYGCKAWMESLYNAQKATRIHLKGCISSAYDNKQSS